MSRAKPLANTVYQVGVHQGVCKSHRLFSVKPLRSSTVTRACTHRRRNCRARSKAEIAGANAEPVINTDCVPRFVTFRVTLIPTNSPIGAGRAGAKNQNCRSVARWKRARDDRSFKLVQFVMLSRVFYPARSSALLID
jgi:hypothetical protein